MLPITSAKPIPERNLEGNGGEPGDAAAHVKACQGIGHDGLDIVLHVSMLKLKRKGPGGELSQWWIAAAGVPNSKRVDVFLYWIHFQRDCADQKREEIACMSQTIASQLTDNGKEFLVTVETSTSHSAFLVGTSWSPATAPQASWRRGQARQLKRCMRSPPWPHGRGLPHDAGTTVQGDDQDLLQPQRPLTL
jgi:hypothetical protein